MSAQERFDISVLYVEDDAQTRTEIVQILQRRVREVFVAHNGSEGLATYREHGPDVVVTDIRMPVMDGLSMSRAIREENKGALIIVTTAHSDTQSLLDAIDIGVDEYVVKPVSVEKLFGVIGKCAKIIGSRRSEKLLHDTETRFRAVFENSIDAIGISKTGTHVFVNPAYLKLFGYVSHDDLVGKPILDLIAPSERPSILDRVQRRAHGERVPARYETRGLKKNGEEFTMDVNASTYELSGSTYTLVIMRDISEQKRAELEREKLIADLQKALADIKTLHGVLPICSFCKKIRDDKGAWHQLEAYISGHSDTEFSHGVCQDCAKKHYPDYYNKKQS